MLEYNGVYEKSSWKKNNLKGCATETNLLIHIYHINLSIVWGNNPFYIKMQGIYVNALEFS